MLNRQRYDVFIYKLAKRAFVYTHAVSSGMYDNTVL